MKQLLAICIICAMPLLQSARADSQPSPAPAAPAGQSTLTCQFNSGPKAGYIQDFRGTKATPAIVGGACTDGQGSNGLGIPDRPQQATLTCQYFSGPKVGQVQDFRGTKATPAIVGGACTDGQGSNGLGISNRPQQATLTCQYFSGPKIGQVQDFRGTKATPAIVGGACTDGQGSNGLGMPDRNGTVTTGLQTVNVICRAPELSADASFSYRLDYVHNTVTDPAGRVRPVQMTDQEITWDDNGPDGTVKNTLQRYSGKLTQVKSNQSFSFSCQPG